MQGAKSSEHSEGNDSSNLAHSGIMELYGRTTIAHSIPLVHVHIWQCWLQVTTHVNDYKLAGPEDMSQLQKNVNVQYFKI